VCYPGLDPSKMCETTRAPRQEPSASSTAHPGPALPTVNRVAPEVRGTAEAGDYVCEATSPVA